MSLRPLLADLRDLVEAEKPKVVKRTVDVTFQNDEYVIEWPNGEVQVVLDPKQVVKAVRDADAKLSKKQKAIIVTVIDWYGVPPGFKPPA